MSVCNHSFLYGMSEKWHVEIVKLFGVEVESSSREQVKANLIKENF